MDSLIGPKSTSPRTALAAPMIHSPLRGMGPLDFASILSHPDRSAASLDAPQAHLSKPAMEPSSQDSGYDSAHSRPENELSQSPSSPTSNELEDSDETEESSSESGDGIGDQHLGASPLAQNPQDQTLAEEPLGVSLAAQKSDQEPLVDSPSLRAGEMADGELHAIPSSSPTEMEQNMDVSSTSADSLASLDASETTQVAHSKSIVTQSATADHDQSSESARARNPTENLLTESPSAVETQASGALHEEDSTENPLNQLKNPTKATDAIAANETSREAVGDSRAPSNRRNRPARWFEKSVQSQSDKDVQNSHSPSEKSSIHGREQLNETSMKETIAESSLTSSFNALIHELESPAGPPVSSQPRRADLSHWNTLGETPAALGSTSQSAAAGLSGSTSAGESNAPANQPAFSAEASSTRSNDLSGSERTSWASNQGQSANARSSSVEAPLSQPAFNLDQAQRLRLIQRVARSFNRLDATGGTVQLRLHPPELGSLSMQVRIDGRNMSAQLTTESTAAREVIMESLPQLRSRLAEQGFEVVQITVEVSDRSALGNPGDSSRHSGSNSQHGPGSHGSQDHSFDLRRSTHLRRQLDAASISANTQSISKLPGMYPGSRGIDLHA